MELEMFDEAEVMALQKAVQPYADEYNFDLKVFALEQFYDIQPLGNYSIVFPFERQLSRARFFMRSHNNWLLSILVSLAYAALIFCGQWFMSFRRKPFELRLPLIIWNVTLALYSAFGFARVSPELFRVLAKHGFVYSVCKATYGTDPVASFWICIYVFSKFVELLDTAFLVLRKKPVMFLHWYHHVTVLIFAWHSAKGVTAAGRWYVWMNYGVHTLMYAYYAARAMNFRPPRWVPISVTAFQLSQMVMGVTITYTLFKLKLDPKCSCHQTWANLCFAIAIYVSYFLLFVMYSYHAYLKPKSKSGEEKLTKKVQ